MTTDAVKGSYLSLLADLLDRRGINSAVWLERSGLSRKELNSSRYYVGLEQVTAAIRLAVSMSEDPSLGLYFGQQLNLNSHGMLGVAGLFSRNVKQALDIGFKYAKVRSPIISLQLLENEDAAIIRINIALNLEEDIELFATEAIFYSFATMAKFLFFGDLPPARIYTRLAKPNHAELYSILYDAGLKLHFNATHHEIHFSKEVLERPLPMPNDDRRSHAEEDVSNQFMALASSVKRGAFAIKEILMILSEMPGYYPSLKEIASRLATTPRTLHRKMSKEGKTYKDILELSKFNDAKKYLKTTNLSIIQISLLLGYNDSSNFSRAFKKWSGEAPLDFRKKNKL